MKVRTLLTAVFCVQFCIVAFGADEGVSGDASDAASYHQQVDDFFVLVHEGKFKESIEHLYVSNPWMEKVEDEINSLKGQFMTLPDMAGDVHSHELIIEQHVSDNFVLLWYVVSFDRSPVSFRFTFYRPQDKWMIYSFQYEDDLQAVARDLARYKMVYGKPQRESVNQNRQAVLGELASVLY